VRRGKCVAKCSLTRKPSCR